MVAQVEAEMDKYMGGITNTSGTTITSEITSTNVADHIGEYINLGTNLTDLSTTGHKADWRIFDADETGVYAILSDYLPTGNIPNKMKVSEAADAKEVTIVKRNAYAVTWLSSGEGAVSDNTEAIGTLTTASNWNFLVPSTSPLREKITGGPTYQQFAKSWNKVNSEVRMMDDTTITEYYDSVTDNTGIFLLIPIKSEEGTTLGNSFWSVSESEYNGIEMFYMNGFVCDALETLYSNAKFACLRPLAHLTSDIKVTGQDANGVWQIAQ